MFRAYLLSALIVASSAVGQTDKEPPYEVPTPKGWAKETIASGRSTPLCWTTRGSASS